MTAAVVVGSGDSAELQRRGYRVVVQQEKGEVTVYLGKREAPVAQDVKATADSFGAALERAAAKALDRGDTPRG